MKLEAPENPNYTATIVRVRNTVPLEGLDNLVAVPIFGYQALVSKVDVSELGGLSVLFTAESQLSLEYASYNNLHRHGDLNRDESAKGYLEDNRRVKAIKLRGHQSNALLMPLESLAFTGAPLDELQEGDTFDQLNGHPIVKKYLLREPGTNRKVDKNAVKKFRRVDEKFLPEHYDTENYWRNAHAIPADAPVVVTQKLHGTSIRIGHTIVKRKLTWLERLAQRLGVKVATTEYDHVYGSRKVIKDPNNPDQNHFYGQDLWTDFGRTLDDLIPQNFIVYGELIGWTPDGSPLQKNYTYDVPQGQAELYIYRVAVVTEGGLLVDLHWDQVKHFAADRGLKTVPELWRGRHEEFIAEEWIDLRFYQDLSGYHSEPDIPVPLSSQKTVDEGVAIRTDVGRAPYILKAKSPIFLNHESKMLDEGAEDLEAEAVAEAFDEVTA